MVLMDHLHTHLRFLVSRLQHKPFHWCCFYTFTSAEAAGRHRTAGPRGAPSHTFPPVPVYIHILSQVLVCSPTLWSHVLACCCPSNLVMMMDVFVRNVSSCERSKASDTSMSLVWTWCARALLCVHTKCPSCRRQSPPTAHTHTRTQHRSYRSACGQSAGPAAALLGVPPVRLSLLGSLSFSSPPFLLSFFDVTPLRARRHQRELTSKLLGARRHTSAFLLVCVSK